MLIAFGIYYLFLAKKNEYLVDNPTTKTFYFKINNGEKKNHYFWSVCKK